MREQKTEEVLVPPAFFFDVSFPLFFCEKEAFFPAKNHYRLPRFHELVRGAHFADVFMAWDHSGLFFQCDVARERIEVAPIGDTRGDAVELFIDTRNRKTAKTTHRFCHHFWFLPEQFEGKQKEERNSFRTEDTHPICSPDFLGCALDKKKDHYSMQITIPREALFGYDPELNAIGFAYRIHRKDGSSQDFFTPSAYCVLEQQPALWASALFNQ